VLTEKYRIKKLIFIKTRLPGWRTTKLTVMGVASSTRRTRHPLFAYLSVLALSDTSD